MLARGALVVGRGQGKVGLYPDRATVLAHQARFQRKRLALTSQQCLHAIARAPGVVGVAEVEQIARAQRLGFMPRQRTQRAVDVEEATLRRT